MKVGWRAEKEPLGQSSLAVTMIEGGVQTNVIPDKCSIRADIRTVPPQSHYSFIELLKSKLDHLIEQNEIFQYRVEIILDRPSILTQPSENIIQIAQMLKGGSHTDYFGVSYYTDGAVLNPRSEIPTLIYGPGDEKLAHQPNEWVSIEAYRRSIQFYKQLILNYGNQKVIQSSPLQGGGV
jgi:succinyl-diaminopimelate desuccinylase